ncbi:MAG: hypothetical protein LBU36_05930 [Clostridiales bacterium]|jgi:hypothetical protein|nr:hypothetical protein [Clostridiales bacterium]
MDYQKPVIGALNETGVQPLGLAVVVETVAVVAVAVAAVAVATVVA